MSQPTETTNVAEVVHAALTSVLAVSGADVTPEADLRTDLGADSLDFAEFNMALEEKLGVQLHDDELHGVTTVTDAVELVRRELARRPQNRTTAESATTSAGHGASAGNQ
ncbi:acyl carrier protein [Lipingzhangella sp. LS1_29]|uniref:Acyl carrier protein n=1 Tax=Lipingzhangella rawalii TaxID=2055835 RepID=A0ABU2H1R8_9ACTN|nr:acyl carrier protein [Lipingzhangella rawalii]MDS1269236.1 acyl carrier protein [Lipingzhangella rawalii]